MAQEQKSAAGSGAVKTQPQNLTDAPGNGASAASPPALPPFAKPSPARRRQHRQSPYRHYAAYAQAAGLADVVYAAGAAQACGTAKQTGRDIRRRRRRLDRESDLWELQASPPIPNASGAANAGAGTRPSRPARSETFTEAVDIMLPEAPTRRSARRRPAGPPRTRIAANDDAPSIGGLIYALDQKPSSKPFKYASIASAIWGVLCLGFAWAILSAEFSQGATVAEVLGKPTIFLTAAAIVVPVAILWFLALLAWRSEELGLRSSTMTEVAIRLAEPDRMAEQSVASLGQAVRRQVSFMNDAISRALGRAGEPRGAGSQRGRRRSSAPTRRTSARSAASFRSCPASAMRCSTPASASPRRLRTLGNDVPVLIDKLSNQQVKLAQIIQGAGENLDRAGIGRRAEHRQARVDAGQQDRAAAGHARGLHVQASPWRSVRARKSLQDAISGYVATLDTSLSKRTESLQAVFEEYARALDTSLDQQGAGARLPAGRAHQGARRRIRPTAQAFRRADRALDHGHRQRGRREGTAR